LFVERPNRFVIIAEVGGKRLMAHCPNPGRMQEILIPGTPVILEKSDSTGRSTSHTFVAAIHRGEVIALHSARANTVAEKLILPGLIKDSESIKPEAVFGKSRFDFAVGTKAGTVLVEVKSCTLCEHGVAMFPDAPTIRGVKHVTEMAEIVHAGVYRGEKIAGGVVLFVVGHPNPQVFIPNIHTDPVFSAALKNVSDVLSIQASGIAVTEDGVARLVNNDVPVEFGPVSLVAEDRGVYLITLFLKTDKKVHTGALGEVLYKRGWYVYVGSAKRGLSARIRRHLSKRKNCRWHIDYLTLAADSLPGYAGARTRSYPIYTDRDLECGLAKSVQNAGGAGVDRFGSSDCSCRSHLYWFEKNPLQVSAFVGMLFSYRHMHGLESFLPASIYRRER
jgi:sugar fermentation stimulation protein A